MTQLSAVEAPAADSARPKSRTISLDALTSLRFFAAMAVVLYHSGAGFAEHSRYAPRALVNLLYNGWLGVPFFFILSGFILTYAHAEMRPTGPELKAFWAARFSRIYPVYLLTLLMSAPFAEPGSWLAAVPQFLLLQAWLKPLGATDWNFVAWTLSVEAFFYVIFPALLVVARGLSNGALAAALIATGAGLLGIWANMTPELFDGVWHVAGGVVQIPVPVLRTPEFMFGVGFGCAFQRGWMRRPGWWAGLTSLAIVALAASSTAPLAQAGALVALGPLILAIARCPRSSWARRLLEWRGLVLLGGASYALYLLQFPVHEMLMSAAPARFELMARAAFAPTLVAASVAVFLGVEDPARRRLRRMLAG